MAKFAKIILSIFFLFIISDCASLNKTDFDKNTNIYECHKYKAEFELILNINVPKFEIKQKFIYYLKQKNDSDSSTMTWFGGPGINADFGNKFRAYSFYCPLSNVDSDKFKIEVAGQIVDLDSKAIKIKNTLIVNFNKHLTLKKGIVHYNITWQNYSHNNKNTERTPSTTSGR